MTPFHLTEPAFRDIDVILAYVLDEAGVDAAYELRLHLFESIIRLAQFPGLGHVRPDLTRPRIVFYLAKPHPIVFDRRNDPLTVHAVLHSARDVRKILRARRLP